MLKKLGPYARPYSKWIAVGVLCSAAEAIFELLIPLVMADIVNIGIETANQNYILQKGLLMMGMAVISLCFGLGAGHLPPLPDRVSARSCGGRSMSTFRILPFPTSRSSLPRPL